MGTPPRGMLALLLGLGLGLALLTPVSAQEIPTGAQRIITKVEHRIAIGTARTLYPISVVQENAEATMARKMAP